MSEQKKKITLVILFIGSVIGIAAALYFLFWRATPVIPPATVQDNPLGTRGAFPSADTGSPSQADEPQTIEGLRLSDLVARGGSTQVTSLTTSEVKNITLSANGQAVHYYDPADGRFYTIDADGNVVALSDARFPNVEQATWNSNSNKAILEFPDGRNIVYNFDTEKQVTLPAHWQEFNFSPRGDDILAKSIGLDPANRWLVTSRDDGSNTRAFQPLGQNANKVTVSWSPNNDVVAFSDTGNVLDGGLGRKQILPIGQNGENLPGLIVEGLDFVPLWSPSGKRLVYSTSGEYSNYRPLLWIVDATAAHMGENRRSLGLNTWADKCLFADESTLYCAAPQSLPPNSGLGRQLSDNTPDLLYSVDIRSGRATLLAIPDGGGRIESMRVSADQSILFYTDGATGILESIRLK